MNQWEIWTWSEHPAIIISGPARVSRKPAVNVLSCSTHRGTRQPEPFEVVLDRADGLDWETLCRCDLIYAVDKTELSKPPRPCHRTAPRSDYPIYPSKL